MTSNNNLDSFIFLSVMLMSGTKPDLLFVCLYKETFLPFYSSTSGQTSLMKFLYASLKSSPGYAMNGFLFSVA